MFHRGKIKYPIVGALGFHKPQHDWRAEIDRHGAKFMHAKSAAAAAQIAHQFGQGIFVVVDDVETGRIELRKQADRGCADAAGASQNQDAVALKLEPNFICIAA